MAKKIKRELECLLSESEKAALAIKASHDRVKARALKDEAKELENAAKEAEIQVDKGSVKRMVECVEDQDFARNTVIVTRTDDPRFWPDGCATVGEPRPMTGDERQTAIDVGDEPDSDEPKVTTKAPKGRGKKSK